MLCCRRSVVRRLLSVVVPAEDVDMECAMVLHRERFNRSRGAEVCPSVVESQQRLHEYATIASTACRHARLWRNADDSDLPRRLGHLRLGICSSAGLRPHSASSVHMQVHGKLCIVV